MKLLQVNKTPAGGSMSACDLGLPSNTLVGLQSPSASRASVTIATAPARLALQGPAHGPAQVHLSVQDTLPRTLCVREQSVCPGLPSTEASALSSHPDPAAAHGQHRTTRRPGGTRSGKLPRPFQMQVKLDNSNLMWLNLV